MNIYKIKTILHWFYAKKTLKSTLKIQEPQKTSIFLCEESVI